MFRARFSRGRSRLKKRNAFFIAMVIFLILTLQSFWYIERRIEPVIKQYAEIQVIQIAADAINDAITKKIIENPDFNELFQTSTDNEGKIQSIRLNMRATNRISAEAHDRVQESLDKVTRDRVNVPLGVALNSNILAMLGPDIPITMVPVGAVEVQLVPTLQETAINNVLITVYLHVTTRIKMIIPFSTEETRVEQSIAIAQELIIGEVPMYYFNASGEKVPFQVTPPIAPPGAPFDTP